MKSILIEKARLKDGRISTETPTDKLFEIIDDNNIVILKEVFPKEKLRELRKKAFDWSGAVPRAMVPGENHHDILYGLSRLQRTPHAYHVYNFSWDCLSASDSLHMLVREIFLPMLRFQHELTGNTSDTIGLQPQLIQYPHGGGMLADHVHPYVPQKVGLILGLTEKGIDFQEGGVTFDVDEAQTIDIEEQHGLGDIALFRFDLVHGVKPVDRVEGCIEWNPDDGVWETADGTDRSIIDYSSIGGRWVAVLSVQF